MKALLGQGFVLVALPNGYLQIMSQHAHKTLAKLRTQCPLLILKGNRSRKKMLMVSCNPRRFNILQSILSFKPKVAAVKLL